MGNESSSFTKKEDVVKENRVPDVNDKFRYCAISNQPLGQYVVICGLGRMYNRLAVLETVMDRSKLPASASHIRSMTDVRDSRLKRNPQKDNNLPFVCPVTGVEMSDGHRFLFNWRCGCVMSEVAYMPGVRRCLTCFRPHTEFDMIVLYGNENDVSDLRSKLDERRRYEEGRRQLNAKISPVEMLNVQTSSPELMEMLYNFKRPLLIEEEVEGANKKRIKRTHVVSKRDKIQIFFTLLAILAIVSFLHANRHPN